jgi:hypothetical protein
MKFVPRKKLIKDIQKRIDRVAKKGMDGHVEFKELMEELINQQRFSVFVDTLIQHYDYTGRMDDFEEIRTIGWKQILLYTNSEISDKLKKLYDKKGVYRQGMEIYNNSTSLLLGTITNIDEYVDLSKKFDTTEQKFQEGILNKVTYLEVRKNNTTIVFGKSGNDWEVTGPGAYQKELLRLYGNAIDYLLSED